MAATTNTWYAIKRDGNPLTISSHNAANGAVGTYLPLTISGEVALSTSPTFVTVPHDIIIQDVPCSAATGTVTLEVNSQVANMSIDYAAHQLSNSGRPRYNLRIAKGSTLAARVVAVLPA